MQNDLLQLIEDVRRSLNSYVATKSLVAPEVVKLSRRLDSLIIEYYQSKE